MRDPWVTWSAIFPYVCGKQFAVPQRGWPSLGRSAGCPSRRLLRTWHSPVKFSLCFQFENELITKLDQEVEGGRGDEQYKVLLEKLWVFQKQNLKLTAYMVMEKSSLLLHFQPSSPRITGCPPQMVLSGLNRSTLSAADICLPDGSQMSVFNWPARPSIAEHMEERGWCAEQWHFAWCLNCWTSTKVPAPLSIGFKATV